MLTAIAIILSLVFIGWLIWCAVKKKPIKAYLVMYGLSYMAGVYTLAFFLTMDISTMIKVLICIIAGAFLIFLAAYLQRQSQKQH
jgi:hypothetical protein